MRTRFRNLVTRVASTVGVIRAAPAPVPEAESAGAGNNTLGSNQTWNPLKREAKKLSLVAIAFMYKVCLGTLVILVEHVFSIVIERVYEGPALVILNTLAGAAIGVVGIAIMLSGVVVVVAESVRSTRKLLRELK